MYYTIRIHLSHGSYCIGHESDERSIQRYASLHVRAGILYTIERT